MKRENVKNNLANDGPSTRSISLFVVGLGASAGGLKSLTEFFTYLQPTPFTCYLVVQHLPKGAKTSLPNILQKHTALDVRLAKDGEILSAGKVFVSPPSCELLLDGIRIRLKTRTPEQKINCTIDAMFTSLAENVGPHAIGLIFSGTGNDGVSGARAIHNHKGLVLTETPSSAQFDAMPKNIIRHDHPQEILSPSEMSSFISAYISSRWYL